MLVNYLEGQNMRVLSAGSRDEMSRLFAAREPNLVLLDLRLDKDDGLDVLRDIRSRSDVPVIIMTGHRRDEIDRVVGLELGADDYVTKPFGLRELLARVRAVLRRQDFGRAASEHEPASGGFKFEGWGLDLRARRLLNPEGAPVPLTKGEYALLVAFLNAPGRPLTREHLLQATRVHEDVFDRSIDVQGFCGCGASLRLIRARRAPFKRSVASAIASACQSSNIKLRCNDAVARWRGQAPRSPNADEKPALPGYARRRDRQQAPGSRYRLCAAVLLWRCACPGSARRSNPGLLLGRRADFAGSATPRR